VIFFTRFRDDKWPGLENLLNRTILLTIDNVGGHNGTEEVKKKLTNLVLEYFDPTIRHGNNLFCKS